MPALAREHGPAALERLIALMYSANESVAVRAAGRFASARARSWSQCHGPSGWGAQHGLPV